VSGYYRIAYHKHTHARAIQDVSMTINRQCSSSTSIICEMQDQ